MFSPGKPSFSDFRPIKRPKMLDFGTLNTLELDAASSMYSFLTHTKDLCAKISQFQSPLNVLKTKGESKLWKSALSYIFLSSEEDKTDESYDKDFEILLILSYLLQWSIILYSEKESKWSL